MSARIPSSGPAREALRAKGQFWTPDWVAEAMVAYVLQGDTDHLFDPAVGAGAFFQAAKVLQSRLGTRVTLLGAEVDGEALRQARQNGLSEAELRGVRLSDFVLDPPHRVFRAIVANPPYLRHHRLPLPTKARLKAYGVSLMGKALDGRAGLHVYFLLRALQVLADGGRLAFILPADICEGVFAQSLWQWITQHYHLDAVITFAPEASPFPGVDTNAVIVLISRRAPSDALWWVRCHAPDGIALQAWILNGFGQAGGPALAITRRSLPEALATGLSRPPRTEASSGPTLGDYVTVMRGIATGANEFFFLTRAQAVARHIPEEYLVSAVGRTRDVHGDRLTRETLKTLDAAGRPTWLLSLDGRPIERFPQALRAYLAEGHRQELPQRALIAMRRPWYKMETRAVPPILFAYLGRRHVRFIRNLAGAVPLTGFLCVYPRRTDPAFVNALFETLNHPATIANLSLVAKSYGAGALKVEPRALERLPLPLAVVETAGLSLPAHATQHEFSYA